MSRGPLALVGSYAPFVLACGRIGIEQGFAGIRPTRWQGSGGWLPSMHYRLLWILAGEVELGTGDEARAVVRDQVVFLGAGLTLPGRVPRGAKAFQLLFDVVHAPRVAIDTLRFEGAEVLQPAPQAVWGVEPPLFLPPGRTATARDLIRRIHGRLGTSLAAQLRANAWLASWLAELVADGTRRPAPPPAADPLARRLEEAAAAQRWSVAEVAGESGVGADHFRRLVRSRLGVPPRTWLRRRRLRLAAEALEQEDAPIAAIAARCGFASAAAFARAFRAVFGCTPSAWRRAPRAPG